jgi:hypothetical protein
MKRLEALESRLNSSREKPEEFQDVDPQTAALIDARAKAMLQQQMQQLGITPELIQEQRYQSDVRAFRTANPGSQAYDAIATEYLRELPDHVQIDRDVLEASYRATAKIVEKLRPVLEFYAKHAQNGNGNGNTSAKPANEAPPVGGQKLSPAQQEAIIRSSTALQRTPSVSAAQPQPQSPSPRDFSSRNAWRKAWVLQELESGRLF